MWIGDINVAPARLDLSNYQAMSKKAGGTIEEMQNLQLLLTNDYIDIWRYQHPDTKQYTWIGNNYSPHYGMRLDNIIITKDLLPFVTQTDIITSLGGTVTLSDHLPISINLDI
jgi:exonuclease III